MYACIYAVDREGSKCEGPAGEHLLDLGMAHCQHPSNGVGKKMISPPLSVFPSNVCWVS